jgi:hypothetical protein
MPKINKSNHLVNYPKLNFKGSLSEVGENISITKETKTVKWDYSGPFIHETNPVNQKIKELIQLAPANWAKTISQKMGKSEDSVYAYVRGTRGLKKGYHKEVLRLLKIMVEKEQAETKKLICE